MEWKISKQPVGYERALAEMDERVAAIHEGRAQELVWLLEHPPLYTAGTSAKDGDLLDPQFPVFKTGRGGQYTYHGPGQRVAYVMLDLKKHARRRHPGPPCHPGAGRDLPATSVQDPGLRRDDRRVVPDIKQYVCDLESWIIKTLERFDIKGERREGRIGIWVYSPPNPPARGGEGSAQAETAGEKKIAAIGVRVRHWITLHGLSINVSPNLEHYQGIVPCGIADYGVTSMKDLGVDVSMEELDEVLQQKWSEVFELQKEAA